MVEMFTKLWYNKLRKAVFFLARYKAIKPKDHKYELAKKRERIRKTVDGIYVFLLLLSILISGLNQFNNVIVGWGLIFMGVISIPATIFHIYIDKKGWQPLFWYDTPELRQYTSKETREKDLSEIKFLSAFETIFLILFSIGFPIMGILKLFEIV